MRGDYGISPSLRTPAACRFRVPVAAMACASLTDMYESCVSSTSSRSSTRSATATAAAPEPPPLLLLLPLALAAPATRDRPRLLLPATPLLRRRL